MKLGDLRKQFRDLARYPTCECPNAATGEHYNECTPEQPWRRRKAWTEPGGRPLDRGIAPPWSDGLERVIGLDVGVGGDSTSMVTMSKTADGVFTVEDIKTLPKGIKEHPFTGVHRVAHEPEDLAVRRICKAVNAVPGAVLDDHRFCATGVRQLGKSLGDRFLETHRIEQHRAWMPNAAAFVALDTRRTELERLFFIACPSQSDPPTLVKWYAARPCNMGLLSVVPPDEPMHRMFAAVAAEERLDIDAVAQPTRLHRVSAFALYPAEVRLCWTCGGSRKRAVIGRIDEAEPELQECDRCRGLGVLWDHRPHHRPGYHLADAERLRFEDAPPPSRHD